MCSNVLCGTHGTVLWNPMCTKYCTGKSFTFCVGQRSYVKLLCGRKEEPGNEAMCPSYPTVLHGTDGTVLWNPTCTTVQANPMCPSYSVKPSV